MNADTIQASTRRGRAAFGAALLLLPLALACAPAAGPAAAPGTPGQQQPAAATTAAKSTRQGGVLKMATSDAPEHLSPLTATARDAQITLWSTFYDPLLNYDFLSVDDFRADFPLKPWLVEKWELQGSDTYIFHLRKGVKFHDGKPMTAEDVIWSLDYSRDPKNAFDAGSVLKVVSKVEKIDDSTIKLVLGSVSPTFLVDIASTTSSNAVLVYPKHVFDEGGDRALQTKGIGTGPYKVGKFEPTGSTIEERFLDWWGKDDEGNQLPYLDAIQFTHNMDRNAQEAAFAAGQLDVYQFASKAPYDAFVKAYPKAVTKIFHSNHSPGVQFNLTHKPLDDIRVRQAINLSIDRDEINETVLLGQGLLGLPVVPGIKKGWGLSPEEMRKLPGYRTPKQPEIDAAKALLKEAGYPDGLKIDLVYPKTYSTAILAEFLPTQLKKVGITLELKGVDTATHAKLGREGNFDTFWYLYGNPKPLVRLEPYFYSKGAFAKVAGVNNPELDKVIENLRVSLDTAAQKKLVFDAQKIILDQALIVTTLDPAVYLITQPWVHDYKPSYSIQADMTVSASFGWIEKALLPAGRR